MTKEIDQILEELKTNPKKELEIFFEGVLGIASKLKEMGEALEQLVDIEREIQK